MTSGLWLPPAQDVSNIDEEFRSEPVIDSLLVNRLRADEDEFAGFTYNSTNNASGCMGSADAGPMMQAAAAAYCFTRYISQCVDLVAILS